MLTLDKIYHASYVLKEIVRPTDMIKAVNLSDGTLNYSSPNDMARVFRLYKK